MSTRSDPACLYSLVLSGILDDLVPDPFSYRRLSPSDGHIDKRDEYDAKHRYSTNWGVEGCADEFVFAIENIDLPLISHALPFPLLTTELFSNFELREETDLDGGQTGKQHAGRRGFRETVLGRRSIASGRMEAIERKLMARKRIDDRNRS